MGLSFTDTPTAVQASDIAAVSGRIPKLVLLGTCCSAHSSRIPDARPGLAATDFSESSDAKLNAGLLEDAEPFAAAWPNPGDLDFAYLGLGWEVNIVHALNILPEFMSMVNGHRTVQEAFDFYNTVKDNQSLGTGPYKAQTNHQYLKLWAPVDPADTSSHPGLDQIIGKK